MLAVGLALISAAAYGSADFLVGLAARRSSAAQANLVVYAAGTLVLAACAPFSRSAPTGGSLAWGAIAGAGCGGGAMFLAAGFRRAEFGVAGPLSAVIGAALAAIAGIWTGNRPGAWAWAGLLLALPAIAVVSAGSVPTGARRFAGVGCGAAVGVGCAVSLAGLGEAGAYAGIWPVLAAQASALATTAAAAAVTGDLKLPRPGMRLSVSSGVIGAAAAAVYVDAVHAGMLAIAAVVTSLFPCFTVGLARALESERLGAARLAGLALTLASVSLIAVNGR
jgi:drug/metabolite transporter (DMT)-like permease